MPRPPRVAPTVVTALLAAALCSAPAAPLLAQATIDAPADTAHWQLLGNAHPARYLDRDALFLNGGAAVLKGFTLRDGVIDVDVASVGAPLARGFFGFQFRLDDDGSNGEWIYLRPHHSGEPDAMQYTPVLRTGANWQLYNGDGFTGAVDIPRAEWIHLRLVVAGAQAQLYVKDMAKPVLVVDDLKSGRPSGGFALHVLTGETYFADFHVRPTPDAPWVRHEPPMAKDALVHWRISPAYDALARDLERAPTRAELDTMRWQAVEAEPPGLVALYRWRDAPHLRVTFDGDFDRRLEPQKGTQVVYARTTIDSDRDQVRKLEIGYSDEVSVFLDGRVLWRGRSAQSFRDPRFLGIVNPENDAVYLPLHPGKNELVLAVSEIGGGWGYVCRLDPPH